MAVNLAELALASWLATEEAERQKEVVTCRNYYDGLQDTFLSDRLQEFLNASDEYEFSLNICRTIVDAVVERMVITGVDTTEQTDMQPLAEWANEVWAASRFDLLYEAVHEAMLRDGEYFVMVDWDIDAAQPRFVLHPRYTSSEYDGDNFGCKAHYPDDDTNQPLQSISKRWIETIDNAGKTRARLTQYFPDRVEKYQLVSGGWEPYQDEGDTSWPIPWRDASGDPLGIPWVHFRNTPDLRSELWDAIPIQKGINKTLIDLLAAADMTGFQIYVALGWIPTTDGQPLASDSSNMATVEPGVILGTTKDAGGASFQAIAPSDLRPLIDTIQSQIGWLAITTSTPESRLSFTRQIAAEGTLKEQNEGLFAKVRRRRKLADACWRDAFEIARRMANYYGGAGLSEDVAFVIQWEPVQSRDTEDERAEWQVKKDLGVPLEVIWAEMGYTFEQIQQMKETEEYQGRMALQGALMGSDAG
jgi:hypothetical protein